MKTQNRPNKKMRLRRTKEVKAVAQQPPLNPFQQLQFLKETCNVISEDAKAIKKIKEVAQNIETSIGMQLWHMKHYENTSFCDYEVCNLLKVEDIEYIN